MRSVLFLPESFPAAGSRPFLCCPEVNGQIAGECRERGIPVNHGGDKSQCDFYFPAVVREDELVIGLTAGGADHKKVKRAAAWLRNHIREFFA